MKCKTNGLLKAKIVTNKFYRSELRVHSNRFVCDSQSEIGTPANKRAYKFDIFECAPWKKYGFCNIAISLSSGIFSSFENLRHSSAAHHA